MYVPNPKQEMFHRSKSTIRSVFGANRSGKTTCGVLEFLWHMIGQYPEWYPEESRMPKDKPIKGRVFAQDFMKGVGEVILPTIDEWIDSTPGGPFVANKFRNPVGIPCKWVFKNGNQFDILTYEMATQQCEGWKGDIAWFDEPPPRDKFIATMRGLVDTRGRCWLTLTPLKQPWIYDELYLKAQDDPSYFCVTMNIWDNLKRTVDGKTVGYLSQKAIQDFEKTLSEDEKEARLHGKFIHLTGLVYKEFDPGLHIVDKTGVKAHWTRYCAIDPHPRMPTAVLWVAVDEKDRLYAYDELKFEGSLKDLAYAIQAQEGSLTAHRRLIDPSADKTESRLTNSVNIRQELMKYGIFCERAVNDVDLGISRIKEVLRPDKILLTGKIEPRLVISRFCPSLLYEFQHYVWDEFKMRPEEHDAKEKPMKKNDHFLDCLRYIMNSNPMYHNVTEEETVITYKGTYVKNPMIVETTGYRALTEERR